MKPGHTRLTEAELTTLGVSALMGFGVAREDAERTCRILVLADMIGVHTHGLHRVLSYGERIALGGIKRAPTIVVDRVAPTIARLDADNGLGPLAGMRALDEGLAMAREFGMGSVFVCHSNHFGPIAPYMLLAAEQGFASFIASNATTTIAPTNGRQTMLGNNPLGFCMPNPGGRPILLDMALSVVARAKIRQARDRGEEIPDTWATDAQGNATTDPSAALDGFLLPVGGYKGYGLSVMVDLFAGLLSGAAFLTRVSSWSDNPEAAQDLVFMFIDTSKLLKRDDLSQRMGDFATILHETPAADPARPVLLPGELELNRLEAARAEGVWMDDKLLAQLHKLAAQSGASA